MTELSPYDKRRRANGVLEDGEYVAFDLMLCDSKSGKTPLADSAKQSAQDIRDAARGAYIDQLKGVPAGTHFASTAADRAKSPMRPSTSVRDHSQAMRDEARDRYIRDQLRSSQYAGWIAGNSSTLP